MKKEKIAYDADDTLIDMTIHLNDYVNHTYKTNFKYEDYYIFDFAKIWGVSPRDVHDIERDFYKSEFNERLCAKEGSIEAIDYLNKKYEPVVFTGRGDDTEHHLLGTLKRTHGDRFKSIHHLGKKYCFTLSVTKGQKCKEEGIRLLIDDYHQHLIRASLHEVFGILMLQPWNKDVTDLPKNILRSRNWKETVELIDKHEKVIWKDEC